nr:hypothetical protein [Tanacetum cinerariifolium]
MTYDSAMFLSCATTKVHALIDGKKVVVSEAIIRIDLHLDDAGGVECLTNEDIFTDLARMGYEKPPHKLTFYKAFFSTQWKFLIHTLVQCLSAKKTAWNEFSCSMASAVICLATCRKFNFSKYIFDNMVRNVDSLSKFLIYTSPALTQKVFANMRRVGKGFSGVETPLFASMLDPTPTPHATPLQDQPSTPHASPPQEQPTTTFESSMSLLTTLMETCATLSQKVDDSKSGILYYYCFGCSGGCIQTGEKIEAIDADEGITLVDVESDEEVVAMDAEPQNQEDVNATSKGVSAAEPTVFDDKEVQEIHLDNIRKYQNHKKKTVSIAQARKNMIIYLKNMAGYKMEHFRGMPYDKVRPIFEREYKKVQTLFKPDKDVEEPKKKRVVDETLLQESFKKLKAVEVLGSESTQEFPSNDPKEMSEEDVQNMIEIIIRVSGITEAYQSFKDMLKGFDKEDLVALRNLVKEKFSSTVPSVDKEKALWVELKRLFEPDADDVLWKLQRYMHAPLTWKLYIDYGVHHVFSIRGDDIFMLT